MRGLAAAFILLTALPAWGDTQFRIRKMTLDDAPPGKGQCDIRLRVDGKVEVSVRGGRVSIRTIAGRDARDDGSECSAPLPGGDITGFAFAVEDGRGETRLLEEPSRGNGMRALVSIDDPASGEGRYQFRLSWSLNAAPDGGMTWNNTIHSAGMGSGELSLIGHGPERLRDATVDVDRGGKILISFRTESGSPVTFTGSVMSSDGGKMKADVAAGERLLHLRGPMYLYWDGRQNVTRITAEATNGQDRLSLHWERR